MRHAFYLPSLTSSAVAFFPKVEQQILKNGGYVLVIQQLLFSPFAESLPGVVPKQHLGCDAFEKKWGHCTLMIYDGRRGACMARSFGIEYAMAVCNVNPTCC